MKIEAPWKKVLLTSVSAIVIQVAVTAFANTQEREPVNHFFSHFAFVLFVSILLISSQRYWTAPKTQPERWPRRILLIGLSVGLFASILGGLSALPYAINSNLKEIQIISDFHRLDQPLLAFGFVFTILGVVLTIIFRIFMRLRPSKAAT